MFLLIKDACRHGTARSADSESQNPNQTQKRVFSLETARRRARWPHSNHHHQCHFYFYFLRSVSARKPAALHGADPQAPGVVHHTPCAACATQHWRFIFPATQPIHKKTGLCIRDCAGWDSSKLNTETENGKGLGEPWARVRSSNHHHSFFHSEVHVCC